MFDVVIVGSGISGLFAAYRLIKSGKKVKICIIEKGNRYASRKCSIESQLECHQCKTCNVLCGLGGAAFYSGAKISSFPAGSYFLNVLGSEQQVNKLNEYVGKEIRKLGTIPKHKPANVNEIKDLSIKAKTNGLKLKYYISQPVSASLMKKLLENLFDFLLQSNVEFLFNAEVENIYDHGQCIQVKYDNGNVEIIRTQKVIIATGKSGENLFLNMKDFLESSNESVDIGLRFEMSHLVFKDISKIHGDLKLKYTLNNGDEIRTFCICDEGNVVVYDYNGNKILDGHIIVDSKNENVNFSLLYRKQDTNQSKEDIKQILENYKRIGDGKPVLMGMEDFLNNKLENYDIDNGEIVPSNKYYTIGNLNEILPNEYITGIKEMLYRMGKFIPGVLNGNNLVYALCYSISRKEYAIDNNFKLIDENIYIIGDACGKFIGILQGAMSATIAVNDITNYL